MFEYIKSKVCFEYVVVIGVIAFVLFAACGY